MSATPARRLPIVCGDLDDTWCLRVEGQDRWFVPIVPGSHDGYEQEQPIVVVDGYRYRVGFTQAVLVGPA